MSSRHTILATAALLASGSAAAHTGAGLGTGFGSGLLHSIVGWDHLLAAVAVGIWASRHQGRTTFMLPMAFLVAMTAGMVLGSSGIALPGVEPAILTSLIILGGALALKHKAPEGLATGFIAAFAIFHGHAHGVEVITSAALTTYGFGLLFATAVLHATGILTGRLAHPLVVRFLGAAIGTAGLWMFAAG